MLSVDEEPLLFLEDLDLFFSLLLVVEEVFTDLPDLLAAVAEPVLVDTAAATGLFAVLGFWDWVWIWVLGLTCTSQGGGALL